MRVTCRRGEGTYRACCRLRLRPARPTSLRRIRPPSAARRGSARSTAPAARVSHHAFADLPVAAASPATCWSSTTRGCFPARLIGHRLPGGGAAECFLVRPAGEPDDQWVALVHPGQRLREGARMALRARRPAPERRGRGQAFPRPPHGAAVDRRWLGVREAIDAHRAHAAAAVHQARRCRRPTASATRRCSRASAARLRRRPRACTSRRRCSTRWRRAASSARP